MATQSLTKLFGPQRVATAGPESVVILTLWPAALCTSLLVPNPVPGIEMPLLVPDLVPGIVMSSLVPDLGPAL